MNIMKGGIICILVFDLLIITLFPISNAKNIGQPDVEIHFAWIDWGFVILVWNKENESIHNVFIKQLSISGIVFLGGTWLDYIKEVGGKSLRQLIVPAWGLGKCLVEATISYEYEGETYETTIYGYFTILGSFTYLLTEWQDY